MIPGGLFLFKTRNGAGGLMGGAAPVGFNGGPVCVKVPGSSVEIPCKLRYLAVIPSL